MTTSAIMPLTNSRGLGKIVFFTGLKFPVVVTPSLMGEPVITAQAYYFLDRLNSVAKAQFESQEEVPTEREIEYIIDNYLFAYSKKYRDSKITSKITEYVYWQDDPDNHYFRYDWRMTECLVLDTLNDPSIVECRDPYHDSKDSMYDWCLFRAYFQEIFTDYRKKLKNAMGITVSVKTNNHPSLGTGEVELPIVRVLSWPLTLEQVEMFEVVSPDRYEPNDSTYLVSRGCAAESNFEVPQEIITTSSYYDAQLLAYYFSAVRDYSPISQFKSYYNVVEYFFEEAPVKLGVAAKHEYQQIEAALRWAVSPSDLLGKINSLSTSTINEITQTRTTSSGEMISALDISAPDIIKEYASHVYQLRNACIHSKKTRKGVATARIVPSTAEERILSDEMPVLQWLAIQCIEKESNP
jgi:hypothetical protein